MDDQNERKAVVSISEMARQCGLSRGRFYQLVGTTFPHPLYDIRTKRPYYTEELQELCLDVRRRNCGIDGRPVLFYAKRILTPKKLIRPPRKPIEPIKRNDHTDLLEGLRSLGLLTVTAVHVEAAMKSLYPSGVNGTNQGEVLRAVFLHLRAQE